jgi:putative transposase
MWNLDPPPGFQGLREDLPLTVYQRHMPHWRQDGATYFVTFRLADSLPENRLRELDGLKADWELRNPPPRSKQALEGLARLVFERIEFWLDQGSGCCVLRESRFSECISNSLLHFHDERYELGCSVIMPNHVHVILRPLYPAKYSLEDIIGSWKSFTARQINQSLQRVDQLWQNESYDRIIRDPEHLWRTLQYIARNPRKAGLARDACRLWVNPAWEKLGWRFEEGS